MQLVSMSGHVGDSAIPAFIYQFGPHEVVYLSTIAW